MKTVTKWLVPEGGGAPLLTMPNIPKPLHGCAPRAIMGATAWNQTRLTCYEACSRCCEICGEECPPGKMDAHELYDYDFKHCTATFNRLVGLCKSCHATIHSGRMLTMYHNHNFYYTKEYMLDNLERAFRLIHQWNATHPDSKPLRVWATILRWADEPTLIEDVNRLIKEYDIHFYTAENAMGENGTWNKWKLIYNGAEYYSPYQDDKEWQQKMDKMNGIESANLFEGNVFEELRSNLKQYKK